MGGRAFCSVSPARKAGSSFTCAEHSTAHALGSIDWSKPWLAPYAALGRDVGAQVVAGVSNAEALNAAMAPNTTPVRFVPQSDLPPGMAYESYIFSSNCCPTREGLHDFFNGMAWLMFPQTKRKLNHLHVAQIAQTGIQPVRGPARDGLTVFDENAAFLQCPDALWDALAAKDWNRLFGPLRPLWDESQLFLFGHALLEKLVYPRKPITAHVYRSQAATHSIADMDTWMAADLSAERLASKPFAHLPVLGVPGWWLGNDNQDFYNDTSVFRPARPKLSQGAGQDGADFGTEGS
jgi:hypothetical protein